MDYTSVTDKILYRRKQKTDAFAALFYDIIFFRRQLQRFQRSMQYGNDFTLFIRLYDVIQGAYLIALKHEIRVSG